VNPEVVVGSVRRRRRSPKPEIPRPPHIRNLLIYFLLLAGVAGLMFSGVLTDRPATLPLPLLSQTRDVRSTLSGAGDSLQIEIGWDLTISEPKGAPDSVRVRVILDSTRIVSLTQRGSELADTAYIPAPKPGETVQGVSCVGAHHGIEQPLEEVCTPWQYVRPLATASAAANPVFEQIVIQPRGLQVDPDVNGRCAEWQRLHPPDSVWIEVNLTAVPECTGPNDKPTVAQFCAFAVMRDGRRVKTRNSSNNRYCDELFVEWIRERYS
jgi:hypothetical protein